jgi:hypothetical protein
MVRAFPADSDATIWTERIVGARYCQLIQAVADMNVSKAGVL